MGAVRALPPPPHPFPGWKTRGCGGLTCTALSGSYLLRPCTPACWKAGAQSPQQARPTFLRHPPPPLSSPSPCLLLLQLPRVVNSLKLLIKNILLSPPKVCFPVIFLLEGDMGGRGAGGGRWPRSGDQPSQVSMEGAEEPGPGGPLPHVTLPGFLAPWGGISEGSNPGCHGARNGASSPGPCAHSSHHVPQDRSRRPWPRPIFTGGRGPCLPVRVLLAPAASGSP